MSRAALGADHVIELGAGTGPVTRELVREHPGTLTVVELQPNLALKLQRRFPLANILVQPAAQVLDEFVHEPKLYALVSSLPFRSLPDAIREDTVRSVQEFLRKNPGSWLVQFTYQPRAPFKAHSDFHWRKHTTVLANFPPAGVWVLKAAQAK